jgi:hypothetical protein
MGFMRQGIVRSTGFAPGHAMAVVAQLPGEGRMAMETGMIAARTAWGTGMITPDGGGNMVEFTRFSFFPPWSVAQPGARVEFERSPRMDEAWLVRLVV